ncbi:putative acyltransferase [Synechococcus sp. PCC 7502]|uniref:acyltransferase family protein n=1 Tax=Synechococcus sp. PCC 7502 TaxID=1173263 RepID=UPI00029FD6C2|nr:acyltransferase [Synechococcus sp. PCC 7502]AFY74974.1 putative acyltransferase [Synechococcus sp. PCC 7502]
MKRYLELDSLRGLAAFAVFVTHAFGLIWNTSIKIPILSFILDSISPIQILWNGSAAVDFFFVLSGFVLALPFLSQNKQVNYLDFLKRRCFRIYPTYWIAMLIAVFMRLFYEHGSLFGLSDWINDYWQDVLTTKEIIKQTILHIFLITPFLEPDTRLINPVIWTLSVELRISLIFPFCIMLMSTIDKKRVSVLYSLIMFTLSNIFSLLFPYFTYLPIFIIGGLTCLYKDQLLMFLEKYSKISFIKYYFLILGLYLYGSRYFLSYVNDYGQHIISAIGSCLLILISISTYKVSRFLLLSPLQFMGKISYSFYLIHLPVMIFVSSFVYPLTKSVLLCWMVSLIISIITAYLLGIMVEIPSQKLAKKLS